jgi:hypothetical protein
MLFILIILIFVKFFKDQYFSTFSSVPLMFRQMKGFLSMSRNGFAIIQAVSRRLLTV